MKREELPWSPYQKKLFHEIATGTGHVIVEARAGSAKTTSIIESFRYIPKGKKTIAIAFNKDIQKELQLRSPSYVIPRTFHSLGMEAIIKRFKTVTLDEWKVFNIAKDFAECQGNNNLIFNICDAVAYCKYGLMDTPKEIDFLISRFGIDLCDLERDDFIRLVIQTLGKDKAMTHKVDFNDQCWFPFIYDLDLGHYDLVFIDERQDLNKSNMIMATKICKKDGGRIIAVGDSFQELYSWRMSDNSIIEQMKKEEGTKTLLLPISYRCPKKVVELVKPLVSDLTCPDTAKEGSIEEISLTKMYEVAKPGCFILSRTNAPLIKICMAFIRDGVRANIRGRDVGKNLISIIRRSKKKQVPAFLKWLEEWKEEEIEKLSVKGISIEPTLDRYECLINLCDELKSLDEVKSKIEELFDDTDEKKIITLSSVHRAKGRERDKVFLLYWTFKAWFDQEGPFDPSDEEIRISYVAATRTKDKLYLVNKW